MLKMDIEYEDGVLYVRLDGALNQKTSYKINDYLVPVLEKHKIKFLVFNLQKLNNIDLKGCDAILNSKYTIKQNKGKMWLCKVNADVARFINSLRINKLNNEREVKQYIGA